MYAQETIWEDIFDKCDPEVGIITMDWAMKMLPRKHRGKQSEWFGKNGMSWHIACAERLLHKDENSGK